ncbi:tetratricopeptide repeat protein 24-like isoform X2 [Lynx rufus]|uniref:tetratricopeptide repeat protein 24-like isoform X2 n=1 Tax=Lynx rufus TaxID=61384 RepID=UPI001F125680|nr:tetratricopeptide repeat protein 24-like isoform X2 [Lynx rufus]
MSQRVPFTPRHPQTSAPGRPQAPGGPGRGRVEVRHRSSGGWEEEELEEGQEEREDQAPPDVPPASWAQRLECPGSGAHLPLGGQGPLRMEHPGILVPSGPQVDRSPGWPRETPSRNPQRRLTKSGFCTIM